MKRLAREAVRQMLPQPAYHGLRRLVGGTRGALHRFRSIDVLPYNDACDRYFHTYKFQQRYGRRPSPDSMLMSDYFFRLKTGPEIVDALRVRVTDKVRVKDFIRETVGDRFNVPTVAVAASFQEALAMKYPARCAIKPTHASGIAVLRKGGEPINFDLIEWCFRWNYYHVQRERNYKTLQPRLIVEPLIFDSAAIDDYKVFCWRGEPKFVQVDLSRYTDHRRSFYDMNWKRLPFGMNYPQIDHEVPAPPAFDLMTALARKLSARFSFIRADFYASGDEVRVGELTNCPEGGNYAFAPNDSEKAASRLLFN